MTVTSTTRASTSVVARAEEALCAALGRTLDAKVNVALREWARAAHRASGADYLAERGGLGAAEAGQLAHLFSSACTPGPPPHKRGLSLTPGVVLVDVRGGAGNGGTGLGRQFWWPSARLPGMLRG